MGNKKHKPAEIAQKCPQGEVLFGQGILRVGATRDCDLFLYAECHTHCTVADYEAS